jgi:hypothetical protein
MRLSCEKPQTAKIKIVARLKKVDLNFIALAPFHKREEITGSTLTL